MGKILYVFQSVAVLRLSNVTSTYGIDVVSRDLSIKLPTRLTEGHSLALPATTTTVLLYCRAMILLLSILLGTLLRECTEGYTIRLSEKDSKIYLFIFTNNKMSSIH